VNPLTGATVIEYVAVWPEGIVWEAGEALTVKSVPVPDRLTVCVLPETALLLSVTVRVAERAPVTVGLNATLIEQVFPAATDYPHACPSAEKSPLALIAVIVSGALPVLERVTVCVGLVVPTSCPANDRALGDTPASATAGGDGERGESNSITRLLPLSAM